MICPLDPLDPLVPFLSIQSLVRLSTTCKKYRKTDEILFKTVRQRLGMDNATSWKEIKQKLPNYSFPYNFAWMNLQQIPKIHEIERRKGLRLLEAIKEYQKEDSFHFKSYVNQNGIFLQTQTTSSIEIDVILTKPREIFYVLCFKAEQTLTEQGQKVLKATAEMFNKTFIETDPRCKNRYRFLCTAERPYNIFFSKDYEKLLLAQLPKQVKEVQSRRKSFSRWFLRLFKKLHP